MRKHVLIAVMLLLLLCGCGKKEPAPVVTEATVPETTAAVIETTVPETAPPKPIVITKDPSGETLSPGGKTWFVAHADNADSVSWEFLSPEGTIYSAADTMSRNPGLLLDTSAGDTIALEKIPLSLNGWSARARFTGAGGTATTEAALITVRQSEGAYDAVIANYRAAAEAKASGSNNWGQYGVSEMISYASHVGYARMDLNGDGTDELLFAGIGYDIPEEPVIFEILTLRDGLPVSVFQSSARSRLFLMADGKLFLEGSSGAANSNFSVMQFSGTELRFLNGLYTTDQNPDGSQGEFRYYYTTSNQFGHADLMNGDNAMDEKVAMTFLDNWRASITLPGLCYVG